MDGKLADTLTQNVKRYQDDGTEGYRGAYLGTFTSHAMKHGKKSIRKRQKYNTRQRIKQCPDGGASLYPTVCFYQPLTLLLVDSSTASLDAENFRMLLEALEKEEFQSVVVVSTVVVEEIFSKDSSGTKKLAQLDYLKPWRLATLQPTQRELCLRNEQGGNRNYCLKRIECALYLVER